jgi:hypothetical protein
MKGLKIEFGTSGADLILDEQVSGSLATVQNGLVNLGTIKGTAPTHVSRGTDLMLKGLRGELVSKTAARHASNFAALNTVVFSRAQDPPGLSDAERIDTLFLTVVGFAGQSMQLEAAFVMADGTEIGATPDIII